MSASHIDDCDIKEVPGSHLTVDNYGFDVLVREFMGKRSDLARFLGTIPKNSRDREFLSLYKTLHNVSFDGPVVNAEVTYKGILDLSNIPIIEVEDSDIDEQDCIAGTGDAQKVFRIPLPVVIFSKSAVLTALPFTAEVGSFINPTGATVPTVASPISVAIGGFTLSFSAADWQLTHYHREPVGALWAVRREYRKRYVYTGYV